MRSAGRADVQHANASRVFLRVIKRIPRPLAWTHGILFGIHLDVHLLWVGFRPSPGKLVAQRVPLLHTIMTSLKDSREAVKR
jgi:hypothetical protein